MLWMIQRALSGPALAIHLPGALFFLSERSQGHLQQHCAAQLSAAARRQPLPSRYLSFLPECHLFCQQKALQIQSLLLDTQRRLIAKANFNVNTTMSFATFFDSVVTTLPLKQPRPLRDGDFSTISIQTASYEEAVLLEEPLSPTANSDDDNEVGSDARVSQLQSSTAATKEDQPNNISWKSLPESVEVEGITLSPTKQISPTSLMNAEDSDESTPAGASTTTEIDSNDHIILHRNGYGVRTVRAPFGITIHVYVATLYSPEPIRKAQDVEDILLADTNTKGQYFIMEFTFLRDITPSQMSIAWNYQLDTSVMMPDDSGDPSNANVEYFEADGQYAKDRALFLELLDGPMGEKGTISLEFHGEKGMAVINQGQLVGIIQGTQFQKAFCSMWFGDKPVMEEIKEGLLQGDSRSGKTEGTTSSLAQGDLGSPINL